ncbi:MAG TPA: hypothetical protein VF588_20270 [Pyrinomonadaceae bacterium]|jgi:hypothetical protein
MLRKYLSLALAALLVGAAGARPAVAAPGQFIWRANAAKVKAAVAKLGVGERARVSVRLRDKTMVKGHVGEAREDDFVVVKQDGTEVVVPYGQVKLFNGDNRSPGRRFAVNLLGIGATVTVFGLVLWVAGHH